MPSPAESLASLKDGNIKEVIRIEMIVRLREVMMIRRASRIKRER